MGCGNCKSSIISLGTDTPTDINVSSCKANSIAPVNITEQIIKKLSDIGYLAIAQKYDLFCLGIIFMKLLLYFEDFDSNFSSGYNSQFTTNIKTLLQTKYISQLEKLDKDDNNKATQYNQYKKLFKFIDINNKVKRDILEYLNIIFNHIFCKTMDRKTCQYVLEKIIMYEKYRDAVFK